MLTKWEKSGTMSQPESWPLNLFGFYIEQILYRNQTQPGNGPENQNTLWCQESQRSQTKGKGTSYKDSPSVFVCSEQENPSQRTGIVGSVINFKLIVYCEAQKNKPCGFRAYYHSGRARPFRFILQVPKQSDAFFLGESFISGHQVESEGMTDVPHGLGVYFKWLIFFKLAFVLANFLFWFDIVFRTFFFQIS